MKKLVIAAAVALTFAIPASASAAKPQLLTAPSQFTNSATQTFEFTIGAAILYQCSLDGAAFAPCTSPQSFNGLAEGVHSFAVNALYDAPVPDTCVLLPPMPLWCFPNPPIPTWSEVSTFDFTVDRTAPTVGFEGRTKQGLASRSRTADIVFRMEAGGSYTCTFDKRTPEPCMAPIAWRNLNTGLHRVKVRGTDAAGNIGAEFSLEFAVNSRTVTYRSIAKTTAKRCVKKKLKKNGKARYKSTCKRVKF